MIDSLSRDRVWLAGGLRCDDPQKKMHELCNLQSLWFPIKDLISDLVLLKENHRLEL